MSKQTFTVGLISDTHGLLRPQAVKYLDGCDAIIHAGDICDDTIITKLAAMAPVHPVAGNMDGRGRYPVSDFIRIEKYSIYVIHNFNDIDIDLEAAGIDIVIFGHTHRPDRFMRGSVTCINPGSAGPERRHRPVSMAKLKLKEDGFTVEFIELEK